MIVGKIFTVICAVLLILSSSPKEKISVEKEDRYNDYITQQISYVKELCETDGSIAMSRPVYNSAYISTASETVNGISPAVYTSWKSSKVCPYFSSIAAIGLLEASPTEAKDVVEKYITWCFEHLNTASTDYNGVDGTIYDYVVFVNPSDTTQCVSVSMPSVKGTTSGAYDSTDSYAALFVKLLYKYMTAFPDSQLVISHKDDVQRVLNAIKATYVSSLGLTYAKPDYGICYLMDNCEVYEGIVCAASLYNLHLNEYDKYIEMSEWARQIKNGIEKHLYSALNSAYYASVSQTGSKSSSVDESALSVFYPNGSAQLFPILCGIFSPSSSRATKLYEKFNERFGQETETNWQTLGVVNSFPWTLIVKVAAMMGDTERVSTYFTALQAKFYDNNCPYPYYCAEAGHVLSILSTIQEVGMHTAPPEKSPEELQTANKLSEAMIALIMSLFG